MSRFINWITRAKDTLGKDAGLQAFESFWLLLEADGTLRLHGCDNIAVCSESNIAATCKNGLVSVSGAGLMMREFNRKEIEISGIIDSIVFQERTTDSD